MIRILFAGLPLRIYFSGWFGSGSNSLYAVDTPKSCLSSHLCICLKAYLKKKTRLKFKSLSLISRGVLDIGWEKEKELCVMIKKESSEAPCHFFSCLETWCDRGKLILKN